MSFTSAEIELLDKTTLTLFFIATVMKQLIWIETAKRYTLSARVRVSPVDTLKPDNGFATGASERDLDPVQAWCEQHDCGVRTSFDTFRFRNKREITMFLLRWS